MFGIIHRAEAKALWIEEPRESRSAHQAEFIAIDDQARAVKDQLASFDSAEVMFIKRSGIDGLEKISDAGAQFDFLSARGRTIGRIPLQSELREQLAGHVRPIDYCCVASTDIDNSITHRMWVIVAGASPKLNVPDAQSRTVCRDESSAHDAGLIPIDNDTECQSKNLEQSDANKVFIKCCRSVLDLSDSTLAWLLVGEAASFGICIWGTFAVGYHGRWLGWFFISLGWFCFAWLSYYTVLGDPLVLLMSYERDWFHA
jgi:hypothetical protein